MNGGQQCRRRSPPPPLAFSENPIDRFTSLFTEKEQSEVVYKWLQKHEKNSHVAFRAANYTDVHWFHIPEKKERLPRRILPMTIRETSGKHSLEVLTERKLYIFVVLLVGLLSVV